MIYNISKAAIHQHCLPLLIALLILRTPSGPGIWYTSVKMTRITALFFPCLKPHPPYSWKCWDNAYNTIFERGMTFCLGFYQLNHAKYVGLTEKVSYSDKGLWGFMYGCKEFVNINRNSLTRKINSICKWK